MRAPSPSPTDVHTGVPPAPHWTTPSVLSPDQGSPHTTFADERQHLCSKLALWSLADGGLTLSSLCVCRTCGNCQSKTCHCKPLTLPPSSLAVSLTPTAPPTAPPSPGAFLSHAAHLLNLLVQVLSAQADFEGLSFVLQQIKGRPEAARCASFGVCLMKQLVTCVVCLAQAVHA